MNATKQWQDIPWHGRALYSITVWLTRMIPAYSYALAWGASIMEREYGLPIIRRKQSVLEYEFSWEKNMKDAPKNSRTKEPYNE